MERPVPVTGATGDTGRYVVAGLLTEGVPVRALVRRSDHGLPPGWRRWTGWRRTGRSSRGTRRRRSSPPCSAGPGAPGRR
ncbi:NmrA family NAD(P)-binding protein [Nocardiopsis flavescens]|uniref:NmrA family NAD(P)-binding protein n=1 Tax=Nocardiopsis flavescens TaxID=758803 RepID=UPI0036670D44